MSNEKSNYSAMFEYNEKLAALLSEELRQAIDDQLVITIGADSPVIWAMNGKIYLREVYADDGREIGIQLAYAAVMPGYNAERHLYSLDSRIYVEDDYVWLPVPKLIPDGDDSMMNVRYADSTMSQSNSDEDEDDDEIEDDLDTIASALGVSTAATNSGDGNYFQANIFKEDLGNPVLINYEPLTVNNFDLEHPILGVEQAYRNAMCEIESFDTPGYIVLMHNGHFYIPVESFEDPVNHEVYHIVKIFNSFPCSVDSGRLYNIAAIELFGQNFGTGLCFRRGYSINWQEFFFDYLLPPNYQDNIADLYKYTDKPYGSTSNQSKMHDYDGFRLIHDDDCGDDEDKDDGDPSTKTES